MSLELVDLRKRFGAVEAVRGLSFTAPDGRVTGLLGPNGAGKTTALRMLSGLVTPDAGLARVDGVGVREDPAFARAHLGLLPDARGLYSRLTARENVRYFGRLHGMGGPELERAVDGLLARLEGRCVLFSSHIMQEVVALCDWIVVMARGVVVAQGTAAQLRARAGEDDLEEAFLALVGDDEKEAP